jgi:peroxiredoxin
LVLLKVAIKDKEEDLKKYKNEFNISTPIMIDDGGVANAYGVWSHPETFFINREGKIVGRALKDMDWTSRSMRNLVQYLLGGKG